MSYIPTLAGDVTGSLTATTVGKLNGVSFAGLASGLHFNTTGTGAPSIATSAQVAAALTGATGTLNLSGATLTIPTLPVNQGGTGLTTTSQNFAFIGPTSGSGAPTWRALTAGDIPGLSSIYLPLGGGTLTGPLTMSGAGITATGQTVTAGTLTAPTLIGNKNGAAAACLTDGSTNGGSVNLYATSAGSAGSILMYSSSSTSAGSLNTTAGGSLTTGAGSLTGPATSGYILASASSVGTITGTPSSSTYLRGDGTWSSPSGSGSVTTFSAGNLSPLFTTSVATATSTPALTFSLTNAAINTVLAGPATGSTGAPTYRALVAADIPSLSSVYLPLTGGIISGTVSATGNINSTGNITGGTLYAQGGIWLNYTFGTQIIQDGNSNGGSIALYNTSTGSGGSILLTSGGSGNSGSINLSAGGTGSGGSINMNASGAGNAGSINMNASGTSAGSITTTAGGSITTGTGSLTGPSTTGYILASVSSVPTATGTPSSSNFLRGDGTWSLPKDAAVTVYTSSQTITPANGSIFVFNGTSLTCTIPQASTWAGTRFSIKNSPSSTTNLTITPFSSDSIEGGTAGASITLVPSQSLDIAGTSGAIYII